MLRPIMRLLLRLTIFSLLIGFLPPAPFVFSPTTIAHAAPQEIILQQSSGSFPSTSVLDTFNRANGAVGSNWTGNTGSFAIQSQQLTVSTSGLLYWATSFGTSQEAYVTLPAVSSSASEIDLLLKGQDASGCNLLEVWYQRKFLQDLWDSPCLSPIERAARAQTDGGYGLVSGFAGALATAGIIYLGAAPAAAFVGGFLIGAAVSEGIGWWRNNYDLPHLDKIPL